MDPKLTDSPLVALREAHARRAAGALALANTAVLAAVAEGRGDHVVAERAESAYRTMMFTRPAAWPVQQPESLSKQLLGFDLI